MTIEEKKRTLEEFERVKELLDELGVPYEVSSPHFIAFDNASGDCMVFPSQTYDDKLVVFYQSKARCTKAEEALIACGVMQGD